MDESSATLKIVQELVSGGEAVPDKYLHKDGAVGGGNHVPLVDIPVIDLILLLSYSPSAVDELDKLRSALASWGCFQAVNHGMSGSFLDRVREITRGYFDLPAEEKLGYSRADDDWTLPYTLKIGGSRSSGPRNQNPSVKRVLEIREVLHEYSTKLSVVLKIMLRAKALLIKLEEGSFVDQFGEPKTMFARFNYYPQCPRPDAVLGLKPLSDGSALTIVLPNKEVEGLRFLRKGKWVGIRIIPEALVINVGDQAEQWSFQDRLSIAAFCALSSDKEIGPINELISVARPRLYWNIKNYPETYFQYYQLGRRPIEPVKI